MPLLIRTFFIIIVDMDNLSRLKFNRILAALIDGLVMFLIFAVINTAPAIIYIQDAMEHNFVNNDLWWLAFSIFASFCVMVIYLFLTSFLFKNATLGMKMNNLIFTRNSGLEMTFSSILLREFLVVLGIVLSLGLSLIFDPLSLLFNEDGKNIYDILTMTKVVNKNDN